MVERFVWVLACATTTLACSQAATTTSESAGEPAPTQQVDVSKGPSSTDSVSATRNRAALQSSQNLPPVTEKTPAQTVFVDRCPIEKASRTDIEELTLAKARSKEQLLADTSLKPAAASKLQTPDPRHLARQDHFLAAAAQKRKSFDAMTPEAREKAYGELKASVLGEQE